MCAKAIVELSNANTDCQINFGIWFTWNCHCHRNFEIWLRHVIPSLAFAKYLCYVMLCFMQYSKTGIPTKADCQVLSGFFFTGMMCFALLAILMYNGYAYFICSFHYSQFCCPRESTFKWFNDWKVMMPELWKTCSINMTQLSIVKILIH